MIETIATAALAVNENLNIQKRRIENGTSKKRLSLVTGTHGDELEGQYLAYMIGSYLDEHIDCLDGIVDIILQTTDKLRILFQLTLEIGNKRLAAERQCSRQTLTAHQNTG